jgi:ATP-binding cassette subfamily B protein/ATP-binding cassette subfamily C protein/ATP-binding cassette subfamily B multidrug efflux pump
MNNYWRKKAGMPASGAINNWRPALTQPDSSPATAQAAAQAEAPTPAQDSAQATAQTNAQTTAQTTAQANAQGAAENRGSGRLALLLLKSAAWPERRHFFLGTFWLLLAAGLEVLVPMLSKQLIDQHLLPRQGEIGQIALLLVSCLLIGSIASWLRYLQLVRLAGLAMRSVQRLREQVYAHVMRLPMAFFDKAITGQLVSRVTNDTEAVKALYVQVLFVMLDSSIVLFGTLLAMAWLDWHLMLLAAMMFPSALAIVWLYQRFSAPAVARARQFRSDINAQVAESIGGMSLLQAHNATLRHGARFAELNAKLYAARMKEIRANAWLLRPVLDLLNIGLIALVIYQFGNRPMVGQLGGQISGQISGLQIGVLYAFLSYIARVVEPLIQITMQFSQLQQSVIAAARVNTLLQETVPQPTLQDHRIGRGSLSLRGVEFAYQPGQPVLHHLNLEIPAGAFFGIVGHTGSGKSTLLSLLLRFYQAQAGQILLDDTPLFDFSNEAFRADLALVPQDPFLLAASVRENIDMGRGLSDAAIETAARAARVHDFILTLEQGYATDLGENGSRLSTGQKQLIAIARALAGQPKILLLDEATSHIDSETEQVVQQALDALRGKVTLVAIAHRLSTIRDADQIIVLNHGKLSERGTHDELMQIEAGIYQRLYLLQQFSSE